MFVKFLQDYRGVPSGEIFYEEGQVVEVAEALQPLKVDVLLAAGRIAILTEAPPVVEAVITEDPVDEDLDWEALSEEYDWEEFGQLYFAEGVSESEEDEPQPGAGAIMSPGNMDW